MTCLVGDPEIHRNLHFAIPIPSMYGIFTYIWLIFNGKCISKYAIHRFLWDCHPGRGSITMYLFCSVHIHMYIHNIYIYMYCGIFYYF